MNLRRQYFVTVSHTARVLHKKLDKHKLCIIAVIFHFLFLSVKS